VNQLRAAGEKVFHCLTDPLPRYLATGEHLDLHRPAVVTSHIDSSVALVQRALHLRRHYCAVVLELLERCLEPRLHRNCPSVITVRQERSRGLFIRF
jgi:hypothetical protein